MDNVMYELGVMQEDGINLLKIYCAEDIEEGSKEWSVDVMQDHLNNLFNMGWTWTVRSFDEFKQILTDGDNSIYVCDNYEIIVDKPFSDEVVCDAVNAWLEINDINIRVEMIDLKEDSGSNE